MIASGLSSGKTICHCFIFREDNSPVLRRQLYSGQFMVKITFIFREDNQPVLHLQRRQSTSASYFGKTIVLVLKKTILLEKTILPFPIIWYWRLSDLWTFQTFQMWLYLDTCYIFIFSFLAQSHALAARDVAFSVYRSHVRFVSTN